jgi:hypothetical protein
MKRHDQTMTISVRGRVGLLPSAVLDPRKGRLNDRFAFRHVMLRGAWWIGTGSIVPREKDKRCLPLNDKRRIFVVLMKIHSNYCWHMESISLMFTGPDDPFLAQTGRSRRPSAACWKR